eukprot:gene46766-57271_t
MPSNQKKIRDLQRLLKSKADSLDNDAKQALLDKISQLEQSKQAHAESEKRKKHMEKYQMVRFFERKKVTRMILNLEKKMHAVSGKQLEEEKAELYEKLTYIMYFPVDMKYIALFAPSKGGDSNVRAQHDHKTTVLYTKALEKAKQDRETSIQQGKRDLVAHAMEVARGKSGGDGAGEKGHSKPSTASVKDGKDSTTPSVAAAGKKRPREEDVKQQEDASDKESSSSDSSDSSDSDSDSDSSDSSSSDSSDSNRQKHVPKKQALLPPPPASSNHTKPSVTNTTLPPVPPPLGDSFFVEEAVDGGENQDNPPVDGGKYDRGAQQWGKKGSQHLPPHKRTL